jgi:hypothetical protein
MAYLTDLEAWSAVRFADSDEIQKSAASNQYRDSAAYRMFHALKLSISGDVGPQARDVSAPMTSLLIGQTPQEIAATDVELKAYAAAGRPMARNPDAKPVIAPAEGLTLEQEYAAQVARGLHKEDETGATFAAPPKPSMPSGLAERVAHDLNQIINHKDS